MLFNTSASLTAITCCDTDLCNDGTNTPLEPNLAYCYSASCYGEGCISGMVDYIDTNDIGTYCAASEDGCQTSMTMTSSLVSGEQVLQVTTGCASSACVPLAQVTEGTFVKTYCCKDRLCNNGDETSTDESKEYCYSYNCVSSTTCLSVSDAAAQGKVAYCEKPNDGCFFSRVVTSDTTILTAGCVGESQGFSSCTAVYSSVDDTETTSLCCNSDKCNNGELTTDPNKKYCYVYNCISAPCMPVAEATQQGKFSYCEQSDNKGCMTSSMISSDTTLLTAGCVGVTSGMDTCTDMSSNSGGMEIDISCCTSSLCNGGDSTGTEQPTDSTPVPSISSAEPSISSTEPSISSAEPSISSTEQTAYCHVYTCAFTPGPCAPLSDAIKEGKTTKCQKSDKGCFAIKTDDTMSAGCVGETSSLMECKAKPPVGGSEVICCKTDGCNSRFTSASRPLFSYGTAILVLLASMFLQLSRNI